ncbi:MAG: RsmB/NOP family class I SAM-dependent RNA methyltransferase [Burkholderiales bacterium]|nr:RsmB/NOP family class I SAM-dependent RNA methyltransferase [Burkholderiales bacterium]
MTTPLFARLEAALAKVLELDRPADRLLSSYFRAHPGLGQGDRALVAETVYAVLRRRRLLEHRGAGAEPRRLALAALAHLGGYSVRALEGVATAAELRWLETLKGAERVSLPLAVACDLPDWIVERLRAWYPEDELLALARALQRTAPLDLRVNAARAGRDAVLAALHADAIAASPTPYSPFGIRVAGRPPLHRHRLFLDGMIEVQDEASQLVCLLLGVRRGEMVADFCAGAGGKSLALAAAMRSTGRVYAFDVSERRLAELQPRLARSGLSNVHPQRIASERDPRLQRLAGKIDRVLIDAPCSGLGTLRRNPDLKWRQRPESVAEMTRKQFAILAAAAALARPGGRLVYATCSLLAEENEAIVDAFLAAHPAFRAAPARAALAAQGIDVPAARENAERGEYLWLLPHVHGTDGFFAALLERAA